jgi:1A family penicillin-binding protein
MPQRLSNVKTYRKNWKKRIFSIAIKLLVIFVALFFLGVFSIAAVFVYYSKDLPRPEKFTEREFTESTKIYDRTGQTMLYELYNEEKRDVISLDQISPYAKNAAIAVEDAKFYQHHGIDLTGILRSIQIDFILRKPISGGSTISQQLIRSTFLTTEKTIGRKAKEIILTIELERRYSKDKILEWYLNQVPFGPNLYGIESASQSYFKKSAKDVSLSQAATLAAMIQSPSYYYNHLDEVQKRRDYVLDRMVSENYILKDEADSAKNEKIEFADIFNPIKAPHFVLYVKDYLTQKYGEEFLQKGGLKVYASLDVSMQETAEKIVSEESKKNIATNAYNEALVAIDPKTGEILAMVGSADWNADPLPEGCTPGANCKFDPKVNVAAYGIGRQPGSSFKPFVYATAFQKGACSDKTIVIDEPTDFGVWGGKHYQPQNYDGLFRGPVTIRSALAQSLNVPSVKVLMYYAGIKDSIENAKKFGITTFKDTSYYGPSIVLGGGEVRLLDMVSAYGVFAAEGLRIPATPIVKIEDTKGNIVEQNPKTPRRVLEPDVARLISDILSDNAARTPMFGANSLLNFPDYQVAVKTGTTSDYRDGWTLGYTPSIVVGVWAGNSDNTPINRGSSGAMIASPTWHRFMQSYLTTHSKEYFTKPYSEVQPQPQTQPEL